MNENETIDNPWIKFIKYFDAKARDGKICWKSPPQKQTMGVSVSNFQHTKFSVIDLVLTDKRNLSGKWPKFACGKSVDFCSQSWEIHYQSH